MRWENGVLIYGEDELDSGGCAPDPKWGASQLRSYDVERFTRYLSLLKKIQYHAGRGGALKCSSWVHLLGRMSWPAVFLVVGFQL